MSLYEHTIINIIENDIETSENDLPKDVYDEIVGYLNDQPSQSFQKAVLSNKFLIANIFYKFIDGQRRLNNILYNASLLGNREAIDYLIEKGANDWDIGMHGAIINNDRDLINFFITKGARLWNYAMEVAAKMDNLDLVNFFIEKGTKDWDIGLAGNLLSKNRSLINFFEAKGIRDYYQALAACITLRDPELISIYVKKVDFTKHKYRILSGPFKDVDMIKCVLNNVSAPQDLHILRLGEVLIRLVNEIKSVAENAWSIDLLKKGWICSSLQLICLFLLYAKQYDLIQNQKVKLDPFLQLIFTIIPCSRISTRFDCIENTKRLSTFEALGTYPRFLSIGELHTIIMINVYEPDMNDADTQDLINDPNIKDSLYRECLLFNSYYV